MPEVAEGAVFQPSALLPQIKDDEGYRSLDPGTKFRDPEGKTRTKPYEVTGDEDYASVPEGALYVGPDKIPRTKPRYEGIGFTAETLHEMAVTPEAQREVLEKFYPGQVKEDAGGLYVDDDGTLRRPGAERGAGELVGHIAAEAAPLGGMMAGGVAGAELGPAGVAGGGMLGAAAGRQFNNAVLALAGIHQGLGAQIGSMATEAAWTGGGETAGYVGAKVGSGVADLYLKSRAAGKKLKGAGQGLHEILESFGITPEQVRYFFGTTPETMEQAQSITERFGGGIVGPSILAPEAPMLKKIEEFDQVFQGRNRFAEAARDFYEKGGKELVEDPEIGVKLDENLTAATKSVSSKRAGELALSSFQERMAAADALLDQARRAATSEVRRPVVEAGGEEAFLAQQQAARQRLVRAQELAAGEARGLVRAGIDDIRNDVEVAAQQAEQGGRAGTLWRMVGRRFRSWGAGVRQRASVLYDTSDSAGGATAIAGVGERLGGGASDFLAEMPQILRSKYPEVTLLEKLAGREAQEATATAKAVPAVPSADLTFKQLRQLRSWLRSGIDYADLTPNMRAGSVKLFARRIDEALRDVSLDPRLADASRLLDIADTFYRENIPFLNDSIVRTVMKGLQDGVPPDPKMLADVLFDPARSEAMGRAREIVGPTLWRYVQAAHTQGIIQKNLNLLNEVDTKGFARSILGMFQDGTLERGYSRDFADRLMRAARNIEQLDGNITLKQGNNDTLQSLIDRAELMAAQIKTMADTDPLKALAEGVSRVDKDFNNQVKAMRQARRQEPLHFLYEKSMTALPIRAANKILSDPDLIVSAANRFGIKSKEMDALRQVYVQRLFQRPWEKIGHLRTEIGGAGEREGRRGIPEEVQAIMFPGVTRKTMLQLVKDVEFLFGGVKGDIGGSLAAASRVLNPFGHIPLIRSGATRWMTFVPGSEAVGRFVLGKFFKTIMDGVSHPNFINWLAGELAKGGAEREMAKRTLQSRLKAGVMTGGAVGVLKGQQLQGQQ